jgi:hypothetical protein
MVTSPAMRRTTLKSFFKRKYLANIVELRDLIGVCDRTVFRALSPLGYLTSYSHAGAFYTLQDIPSFDAHGLWFHGDVRFSKHGTLRATIVVLVQASTEGYTHQELEAIVGLRVHDTLRSLVEDGCIQRQQVDLLFVYLDADEGHAAEQLRRRRGVKPATSEPSDVEVVELNAAGIIDVLVAVIRAPKDSVGAIATRLRTSGVAVTDAQVQAVFARYGLGKKTAPSRSRSSPRSERMRSR